MDEQEFVEASIDLQAALQELSESEQNLIWMWSIGYTQQEIAVELGVTQPAVSQKVAAILEKLRGLL